ncbi:MAG: TniQ family protein [Acidobacteria bacterium]|nr:TniQ family protein [Acidobacteriota bacterium]
MELSSAARLLISGKPYPHESFMGYFLRLTEKNGYDSLSWIFQMADVNHEGTRPAYILAFEAPERLTGLAQLAGINLIELIQLTHQRLLGNPSTPLHYFFGQPVTQDLIRSNRPKICPDCLSESPYCRRVWELSALTACPTHRRLLIDECPKCKRQISWSRKIVTVCSCKFDWRESPASSVVEQGLRLTRHIYQLCGLPVAGEAQPKLPEPISKLSLNDLLLALFFVAGQQRGFSAATSRHLVAAGKSKNFHRLLTEAYSVFDNWPVNYFRFLDQRRAQERKVTRTYQRMKSTLYREFGSFYSGLHSVLSGSQFDFIRGVFVEYLTQKRMLDCLPDTMSNNPIEDSLKSRYVLKSDARRLTGADYAWINHCIRIGRLRTIVRSKGKKRLIFIKVEDVAKLRSEY